MRSKSIQSAERLMSAFAIRTGLHGPSDPTRRYLWTDAYALTTLLALHRATAVQQYLDDAIKLADLVHEVLGRHRPSDARTGWISGLDDAAGALRPTAGGLRIGKPLRERALNEPLAKPQDERLEWDRDGQYFHYLTRWAHALSQLALATGDAAWNAHAIELAHAAVPAFTYEPRPGGPMRMYWKMSIDLTRPLVASMGQHDPLDGLVTLARVRATQHRLSPQPAQLDREIDLMRAMCFAPGTAWATTDALGIGSVLEASAELIDLSAHGDLASEPTLLGFIHALLADAHRSIDAFAASDDLSRPLEARLPFRELGLAIGLRGIAPMRACVARHPDHFGSLASNNALRTRLEAIARLEPLAEHIEQTWLDPAAQRASTWSDHREINSVMLAASLCAADGVRAPVHAPVHAPAPAPAPASSSVSLASARASSGAAAASS